MEYFFILFLISGYIKSIISVFGIHIPIDLTLLLATILTFYIVKTLFFNKFLNKEYIKIIIILSYFFVWIIFSSLYTSSSSYWLQKIVYFITNILAFIFPLLMYKKFNISKALQIFIISTTILNLYFVINILPHIYSNTSYYAISGKYLSVSLFSGLNILLFVIYKLKIKSQLFTIGLIILNSYTLIMSGGRGGILFTFLILIIYLLYKIIKFDFLKINSKKIILIAIFIILTALSILSFSSKLENNDLLNRTINRLELLNNIGDSQNAGASVNSRFDFINFSLDKSLENIPHFLFGYGIGSFSIEYTGIDGRGYPHNIIVEILFELGLIGVFLFLFFYFFIIKKYRYSALIWIVLYMTLHILKSSSLVDIREFFAMLSLMMLSSNLQTLSFKKEYKIEK